ncbi:hypothetical protein SAMN02745664_101295 [Moraxella cuniculi DSM 21768]|uniref:Phage protein D n=1 Tax=Moraxella cuniculi DSM 21768 TaxID=1122245 RepID=A0A1N7DIE7_9GAMM|nr:contractile injection system protein, VgrG/Pvc8 family [Moraxella cuniculi]OOS08088.1 hypothetical protein B0189_01780 [Moraxella cuniculi]SIR75659.1 hypothetical protein SAMN02745664_101295 [Moraxella cuniculi DSM 21768]
MIQNTDKPKFAVIYEQKDITNAITPYLLEITYTDYLSDQSDEIQITLEDVNDDWLYDWYPDNGDGVELLLADDMDELIVLGRFEISEIEYRYPPSVVVLKALSTGISKANRTNQAEVYKDTTLANIVRTVAKRLNLSITGQIRDIKITTATQYQERDVEFLTRLAKTYGHSFKIVDKTLVFYDNEKLGENEAVAVLDKTSVIDVRFRDVIKDMPSEVQVSTYNTQKKQTITKTAKPKPKRKGAKPTTTDTLKITAPNNATDGEVAAMANAHAQNQADEQIAGEIELVGNAMLVAGQAILVQDFGKFSGKYLIKQARHILNSQGFLTTIEIKMLEYIDPRASDTQDKPATDKKQEKPQ